MVERHQDVYTVELRSLRSLQPRALVWYHLMSGLVVGEQRRIFLRPYPL